MYGYSPHTHTHTPQVAFSHTGSGKVYVTGEPETFFSKLLRDDLKAMAVYPDGFACPLI